MPVLRIRVRFQPIATHVEPHRRVERHLLVQQQMRQLSIESRRVCRARKISTRHTPVPNRLRHPSNQRPNSRLPLRSPNLPMQVLRGNNIGRRHGPVRRHLHVLLFEDRPTLVVLNDGVAQLPGDLVKRRDARACKVARERKSGGAALRAGRGGGLSGRGIDRGVFGLCRVHKGRVSFFLLMVTAVASPSMQLTISAFLLPGNHMSGGRRVMTGFPVATLIRFVVR